MADVVKATLNVSLQNPLRGTGSAQIVEALPDSIVCASSDSKAVGVRVCQSFCQWFQCKLI